MEEIIYCKDCKFCKWRCSYVCENRNAPWSQGSEYSSVFINEDDFCSYAEPKENRI